MFKLKIKVKRLNKSIDFCKSYKNGDWIDLRASETRRFISPQVSILKGKKEGERDVTFDTYLMPLGVAIKLPDGFEANVVARSSLPLGMGIVVGNSFGVIDTTYCGNNDEWKAPLIALRKTTIKANERICQFRIQLSQKATMWQKIKWLFTSGIEIVEVDELPEAEDRGGFGGTGKL